MRRLTALGLLLTGLLIGPASVQAQRYTGADGRLRVALAKQPFSPTGISTGPNTMGLASKVESHQRQLVEFSGPT